MRHDATPDRGLGRTVVGAGLLALDVVVPDAPDAPIRLHAGGTCGNVLTALAFLGWASYPVARLGADGPMHRVRHDLARWGVHLDFLLESPTDGTPVIAQHIRRRPGGGATHSFSWRCPACGADLPRYKPLRLTDVEAILPRLPEADVFFADRTSAGIIRLMRHYRDQGSLVVFEPSGVGDPRLFREAVEAAHVVKYSQDRLDERVVTEADARPLVVETMGGDGLRYRAAHSDGRRARWTTLPAIPVPEVRDTAGCGDWNTAGLLDKLSRAGAEGLLYAQSDQLVSAIRYGQALAAWNCQFEGARGGMYVSSKEEFDAYVSSLLRGEASGWSDGASASALTPTAQFTCSACPPGRSNGMVS